MKNKTTDIVVAGAGLSGICAAIAAARNGSTVALITNRPTLGGNSSSEIRVWTRGAAGAGNLFGEEMGILGELKLYNEYLNPNGNPVLWDEVLLDTVLAEKNITLYLNCLILETKTENDSIKAIIAREITSENTFTFFGKIFIDATGDGFLGFQSSVPYTMGKEDKHMYGEENAGESFVQETQGNTLLFFTKKDIKKVPFIAPKYAYPLEYIENLLNNGGRVVSETTNGCDLWWAEFGGQKNTINDYQEITMENKKLTMGIFNYIKNSGKFDADNIVLEWVGSLPGKRESRRFITEYVVNANDILGGKQYDDVGFYGGWYMDFHPSEGIYSKKAFCEQVPVNLYEMPLSCLYNKKVKNLLFAGRNIGTSHFAFASSRVMNTCALSGQASGTLASVLTTTNRTNNDITSETIETTQKILRNNDMFLLSKAKDESENLAKEARITASNTLLLSFDNEGEPLQLSKDTYIAMSAEMAQSAVLTLESENDTNIAVTVYKTDVPHRIIFNNCVKEQSIAVKKGNNEIALNTLVKEDAQGYITIVFEKYENISIKTAKNGITGVVLGQKGDVKMLYPLLKVATFEKEYGVKNIVNGYNRPYKQSNMWASQTLPATVEFAFGKQKRVSSVECTFNPNLSTDLLSSRVEIVSPHHLIEFRNGICPQLVKKFDVYAIINGAKQLLASVDNNYQRVVKVDFDSVQAEKIIIDFKETYGEKHAEVFEIKIW